MKDKKVFKKSSKSTIVAGLMGFILLFQFLLPSRANASLFSGATQGFVQDIVVWVLLFLKTVIVSGIMKLAAWLTAASLSLSQGLSTSIADPTSFIYVGWGIFRDIANLGFVFGIILIAVATILRIQRYQAQSILSKLIVAALIVNFSLVICGAILKVSDVFSNSFLGYITQNQNIKDRNDINQVGSATAKKITDETGIGSILSRINSLDSATSTNASSTQQTSSLGLGDIVNIFIQIIMAIFVAFVLLVLAVMFLLRYFNLAFLMILAPGAWLMWIFPIAYRYWRDWWTHFLKWVFFAPLMLLFIWLTVVAMDSSTANILNIANGVSAGDSSTSGFSSVLLSLMGVAFLIGGLKIASSLGMAGSNFILGQATKVKGWAQNKAKRGAAKAGNRIAKPVMEKTARGLGTLAGKTGFVGRWTAGIASRGLTRAGAAVQKEAGGTFRESKEEYGKLYGGSKERLLALLPNLSGQKKMAVLALLDEKGWLQQAINDGKVSVDEILNYEGASESVGVKKEFSGVIRRGRAIGEVSAAQENFRSNSGLPPTDPIRQAAETRMRNAQMDLDRQYSDDEWKSQGETYFPRDLSASGRRTADQTFNPNSTTDPVLAEASHKAINAARSINSGSEQAFLSAISKTSTQAQGLDVIDSMIIAAHQQDDSAIPTRDIFQDIQDARTALLDPTHPDPSKYRTIIEFLANSKNNLHKKVAKRIQETQLSNHLI